MLYEDAYAALLKLDSEALKQAWNNPSQSLWISTIRQSRWNNNQQYAILSATIAHGFLTLMPPELLCNLHGEEHLFKTCGGKAKALMLRIISDKNPNSGLSEEACDAFKQSPSVLLRYLTELPFPLNIKCLSESLLPGSPWNQLFVHASMFEGMMAVIDVHNFWQKSVEASLFKSHQKAEEQEQWGNPSPNILTYLDGLIYRAQAPLSQPLRAHRPSPYSLSSLLRQFSSLMRQANCCHQIQEDQDTIGYITVNDANGRQKIIPFNSHSENRYLSKHR